MQSKHPVYLGDVYTMRALSTERLTNPPVCLYSTTILLADFLLHKFAHLRASTVMINSIAGERRREHLFPTPSLRLYQFHGWIDGSIIFSYSIHETVSIPLLDSILEAVSIPLLDRRLDQFVFFSINSI